MRKLIFVFAFVLLAGMPVMSFADSSNNTGAQVDTVFATPALEAFELSLDNTQQPAVQSAQPAKGSTTSDDALRTFILSKNSKLSSDAASNIVKSVNKASEIYGIEREMIISVMWIESNFDPSNVTGQCIGLMQIHKNTGAGNGLSVADLYNSDKNIKFGVQYLKWQQDAFGGDILKGLSAYNQGPNRVKSGNYSTWYQDKVMDRYNSVKAYIAANSGK